MGYSMIMITINFSNKLPLLFSKQIANWSSNTTPTNDVPEERMSKIFHMTTSPASHKVALKSHES